MAHAYLLDSNVLIAAINGTSSRLLNRLAALPGERLRLSSIVLAELLTGAEKSTKRQSVLTALEDLAQGMPLLPFDADDARAYARIRAALEIKGSPIGPHDLQIAAQAVARNLVLVTANLREFRRVPGLVCENWLR